LKILITSPDAIYDKQNGENFKGVIEALDFFLSLSKNNEVVVVSLHSETLQTVPDSFNKLDLSQNKKLRKSPDLIRRISKKLGVVYADFLVLGAKDDDMILAANAKILLLTAVYANNNNPEGRIYSEKYGIAVYDHTRLKYFFEHYIDIETPWYFSYTINKSAKIYGLTNAMTGFMDDTSEINISNHLKNHLKDGHDKGENSFRIYSLLSAYRIFPEIDKIYAWGYYPSSNGAVNEPLLAIKEILRKSFKSSPKEDILIRHKPSVKRSRQNAGDRASAGCDNQFDSIYLNPRFRDKIKGRDFCIIDDFSTHGTSCETVRHLLEKAGANKVIFISLGKYKVTYKTYDYAIKGDVFTPNYTYKRNGNFTEKRGVINNDSSSELLTSLRDSFL
jgi:hypothetical protein